MEFDDYLKEQKIINLAKANAEGLKYLVFFSLIFAVPFYFIWDFQVPKPNIPLLVLVLGIVLHELIHGMFFALFASKGLKSIKFGILWKMLTPYCHCKEPLKIREYSIALLAPLVILGLLPAIISLFTGSAALLLIGMFFSVAAAGDIMIFLLIRKENPEDYVQDHPSEAGYYIFRKN